MAISFLWNAGPHGGIDSGGSTNRDVFWRSSLTPLRSAVRRGSRHTTAPSPRPPGAGLRAARAPCSGAAAAGAGSLPATPPLSWFIVAALPRTSRTAAGRLGRRSASRSGARTAPPAARADAASCQTDAVGPPRAHIAGTRRDASPGPPRTRSRTRRRPQRASGTRSAAGTPAPSRIVSAPPVAWNRATAGPFPDGQSSARPAPHPRRPTPWSTTSSTSFAKSRRTVRVDAAHPRSSTAPPAARRIISQRQHEASLQPAARVPLLGHPPLRTCRDSPAGHSRDGNRSIGREPSGWTKPTCASPRARKRGAESSPPKRNSEGAAEPSKHAPGQDQRDRKSTAGAAYQNRCAGPSSGRGDRPSARRRPAGWPWQTDRGRTQRGAGP